MFCLLVFTGDNIRVFRVMERVGNIRAVRVTTVKNTPHFRAVNQRCVPASGFSGVRFGLSYPLVVMALFGVFTAEVQLHPVAAQAGQPGRDIPPFPGF
ncbi:Uncharacterised protein [Cedecea davisae]|nr:Uncharacterised protein [Cedecea davisae]